tara:strand:+ start:897 stop:1169 length:273 start_codon:yes stop_codon:yes gene_type:complete
VERYTKRRIEKKLRKILVRKMSWKNEIKKEDDEYRNYAPTDTVESMVEEIQDLCNEISDKAEDRHALEKPKMLAYCIDKLSDILQNIRGY